MNASYKSGLIPRASHCNYTQWGSGNSFGLGCSQTHGLSSPRGAPSTPHLEVLNQVAEKQEEGPVLPARHSWPRVGA